MKKLLFTIGVVGLIVTACGEPTEPASIEGAWQLVSGSLDGEQIPLLDSHPITMSIEGDTVGGVASCNSYGGSYTLSDGEVSFSALFQTEMACSPEEAMAAESAYLDGITRVSSVTASDDSMTLSGEGVELEFAFDENAS
jgi:heat shock protein HslJ